MTLQTEIIKTTKRADEVKFVLRALIAELEAAEAEAADTTWSDEKKDILESALVSAGNRCLTLAYDLTHWDTDTVLYPSELLE